MKDFWAHETAVVDDGATIGSGTKIWHFAHIFASARIGERCSFGQNTMVAANVTVGNNVKVQNNVAIYEATTIEDDVFLGPSCVLTNVRNPRSQVSRRAVFEPTRICRGATVGANATIVCGVTLGQYCFVAAGAVVTRDVLPYGMVVGVPARQSGWISRHGHPLKLDEKDQATCPESGFRYKFSSSGAGEKIVCLDLDEDAVLPPKLSHGTNSYRQFRDEFTVDGDLEQRD